MKLVEKNQEKGITLVALIITIIVLVILAAVAITTVYQTGIIEFATQGVTNYSEAGVNENRIMNGTMAYVNSVVQNIYDIMGGDGGRITNPPEEQDPPQGPEVPTTVVDAMDEEYEFEETKSIEDGKGNKVTVPGGFHFATDSGTTVQEGIVVEDSQGNQFVWIPVSNTKHNGSNPIKKNDGTEVEITLGRYTFDTSDGSTGAPLQYAKGTEADYTQTVTISDYYQEIDEFRDSDTTNSATAKNATAKNLGAFIESVEKWGGYYLGRYEASYASGSSFGVGSSTSYYKPQIKKSTSNSTSSMSYTKGRLWNFITQGNASKVARNMYYGNSYVESDLVNSYMWDTAIVYIQSMGNSNYANQNRGSNTSLKNTGETGDEKCKINDMAGNLYEWTTESSTSMNSGNAFSCVYRACGYTSTDTRVATRGSSGMLGENNNVGFRVALYVK